MDPLSLALAGIGLGKSFLDTNSAKSAAKSGIAASQANISLQQQMLANALMQAQGTTNDRLKVAGAQKTDQFGNTTQYDPSTGRWVTVYTPEQQKLIDQGQQRQERTNLRGAQASEDYNTQRSGYLNLRPKSEAESYAEIAKLIQQAQGQGDRALSTLVNRQELRQQGNMPVINSGPLAGSTAGQRLAETMLKARSAALSETGQREQIHSQRYLPGMAAFEKTANTVAPVDPTGSGIIGMAQQGSSDISGAYGDLTKALMSAYGAGSGALNQAAGVQGGAYNALSAASAPKNELSQFAALIKALQPNSAMIKAGQGVTPQISGTTYSAGSGSSGSSGNYGNILQGDHPYSKLIGSEAAPIGITYGPQSDPYVFDNPKTANFDDRWFF